jgi:hypothetical protein
MMETVIERARSVEQFLLRVKKNSELDKMMRAMLTSDRPLTNDDLMEIGGHRRSGWLMRFMDQLFDNVKVTVKRGESNYPSTLHYVDVNPGAPIAVGADVVIYDQNEIVNMPLGADIKWPQAPPMVDSLGDVFRKPAWFDTMAAMVDAGRHIALSGPPGVGKDTAVQELAAEQGRVLVTIGGDAGFRRKDLVGNLQIASGRSFFEVAEYAAAVTNGWWALISEVNAADADALLFLNAQLAAPYIINIAGKAYPVHPDFRLFVTYNAGLVGTKPLPQSFKDRFFSVQVPFFTEGQLHNILIAHGAPDEVWVGDIVRYGIALWNAQVRGQLRYQVTSRRLMDAVELMKRDIATSTIEALTMAVIASIDSPVEANVAKQILNSL